MKKLIYNFIIVLLPIGAFAQQYDYAQMLGGVRGDSYGQSVISDNAGNVYVKGTFNGSHKIGSTTYTASGTDAFIAKYSSLGALIWYKSVGFDNADTGESDITLDASNNIYITGSFSGTSTIEGTTLTNFGAGTTQDIYVIKYDTDGVFQWARNFGGTDSDYGQSIAVDAGDNVYIGGYLKSTSISFNGSPIATGASTRITYWLKLNADGTDSWLRFGASTGPAGFNVYDMAISDATGSLFMAGSMDSDPFYQSVSITSGFTTWIRNISSAMWSGEAFGLELFEDDLFITGYFDQGNINFPRSLAPLILSHTSLKDIFLVSVDTLQGFANWGNSYGGTEGEEGRDITINPVTNELYITGNYASADLTLMGTPLPPPATLGSPFIALANTAGNEATSIPIITTDMGTGTSIALSNVAGSLFAVGSFKEKITFGLKSKISKNNSFYIYTSPLSDFGGLNWFTAPPKGEIIVQDMVVDNSDNLLIAGTFSGTVDVFGDQIASTDIENDLFIAKIRPDETLAWITTAGGDTADEVKGISFDGEGSVYINSVFTNVPVIAGVPQTISQIGAVIVKLDQNGTLVYANPVALPVNSGLSAMVGDNSTSGNEVFVGGYYEGSANIMGYNLTSDGLRDIFVFKLASNGGVPTEGLIAFAGTDFDMITDMAKTPTSDILITGYSRSPTLSSKPFGPQIDITIPAGNKYDKFVASISTIPEAVSGFSNGDSENEYAQHISIDGLGNIIIAGEWIDSDGLSVFIVNSFSDLTGTENFENDISSNNGGGTVGSISDLATDGLGNIYLSGDLKNETLNFNGNLVPVTGDTDGFFAGYDVDGNLLYAEAFGGDYTIGSETYLGYDDGHAVAVNSSNDIWYSGTLAVKPETFDSFTLQPYGSEGVGINIGMDSYLVRIASPSALAAVPKIYWTDSDEINRSNVDGASFEQFFTASNTPEGIAVDSLNSTIYWSTSLGDIWKGTITSTSIVNPMLFIDDGTDLNNKIGGISLDVPAGKIYWASTYDNSIKVADLFAADPFTTIQILATVEDPRSVTVSPADKIYYTYNVPAATMADPSLTVLESANLDGSSKQILTSNSFEYYENNYFIDVKVDDLNNKIYWSGYGDNIGQEIFQADLSPFGNVTSFSTMGDPIGLEIDPRNAKLYWVEKEIPSTEPYQIYRADLDNTNIELLHSGLPNLVAPRYLALNLTKPVVGACVSPPTIDAGADRTSCGSGPVFVSNDIDLTWTTDGDGSIDIPGGDIPPLEYNPGPNDLLNGTVTLTVTSNDPDGPGPCLPAMDSFIITFLPSPTTSAGTDQTICETDLVSLNGTIGGTATSLIWTTDGNGTFDDNLSATAFYTPGTNDLLNGTVTLTITTDDPDGTGSCVPAADEIVISIDSTPTVDAGVDQAICPTDLVSLSGVLGGSASLATWTTNGDGTFDDSSLLTASYTPGTIDLVNATATLTLTTTAGIACPSINDFLVFAINQPITVINQSASLDVESTVNIDVMSGGTFNTGDNLITTLLTQPAKGTATVLADGSVDFTSAASTVGADSFDFELCNQCGQCSSATVDITINNVPPTVSIPPSSIESGGKVTINVLNDLTDDNGNVDLSSLRIIIQPLSGAIATLDATGLLTVDYASVKFAGTDELTIEICDLLGFCTQTLITIEVAPPGVVVFNALSPNGDGKHDFLEIEGSEFFPDNQVKIMNRWGEIVYETNGYDNSNNKFSGINTGGGELPSGTYYYLVSLGDGSEDINGFFSLRR